MRKLGIAILIVVALAVVAALALPYFLDVNRYRDRIQAELQKRLDRQVSLGHMRLSLFPLAFRVENAVIGEDPAFKTNRPFAQVEELYITAKLGPLLRREVQVDSIELRKPRIELVRNAQGVWNFASLGHQAPQPPPPAAPPVQQQQQKAEQAEQQQAKQQPQQFAVENIRIRDGQVAITDVQKHQSRAVYDHIDLTVDGFQPGKAFDVNLAAHLPGQGKQTVELGGRAGPVPDGSLVAMPFEGTLKLEQVSLSAAQRFLNTQALADTDAIASGEAKIRNEQGKLASSGSLKLENARIRSTDIGYPISADYDISDDLNTDVITITKGELKLGSTPLSIRGALNTRPTPAQADLKLTASNVSIEEAARLAAAFGVAFNPGMKISGRMSADLTAQGALSQPTLNGTLSAKDLVASGKDVPKPVQVQAIELALTPQAIRSNQFTASSGGTSLTAQFTLSQYTSPDRRIDLALRTYNAEVGELLAIAKTYGVSAMEGMAGSGSLSLDVRAVGPLKSSAAMNFSGNGVLENASLRMPSLTQPLQVKNAKLRFTQNSVVLENVAASLGQTNASGTLTLRNFSAPQVQFTLAADKFVVREWQQMFPQQPPARAAAGWSLVPRAWAQAPQPPGIMQRTTGKGTLTVGTVLYDQLVLNNVRSNVTLDHGLIRLDPVKADAYGGAQTGVILVDTRPAQTVYTVDMKMDKVDANKLISSVSSLKDRLYGLLASNVDTRFSTTQGATADQIARSLNGKLSLNLSQGKLEGMDIMNQVSTIGKFLGYNRPAQNFTGITQLTGDFDVRNGVATTRNLRAAIDGGTLAGDGSVNLAEQTLNMHVTAVLPKTVSEQVGGTRVGGFMETALANSKGELVVPILVTGSFSNPRFAPDLEKIARMKLEGMLPTSGDPGSLTSGVLGAILGQKGGQQTAKDGDLGSILGGVLGGKKQQEQPKSEQPAAGQQPPQQEQQKKQQTNPWEEILGAVTGQQQQKKKPTQQQQQQQQQQQEQPPEQPK